MSYWQERQLQLIEAMEKDETALKKRLSKYYEKEANRLDKEIAAFYQKYGENNIIEYRRLMENLSEADKRLLLERMDEFAAKYPQYANLMPVREDIYKLNRLEGLQYSVQLQRLDIGAVENEEITAYLNKQALRGVNAAAEVMGFGKNYYANNPNITKLFVDVPWVGGENFSQRIWVDTQKVATYITQDMASGFARGDNYQKLTKQLQERFINVTKKDAYRLVFTEGTYVMAESSIHPFTEDFEYYKVSIADSNACHICKEKAEESTKTPFPIKGREPGATFPPFHPWCRCTFEIVVEDWDKWMDDYVKKHSREQGEKIEKALR